MQKNNHTCGQFFMVLCDMTPRRLEGMCSEGEKVWEIYKNILTLTDCEFDYLCNKLINVRNQHVDNFVSIASQKRKSLY